MKYNQLGNTGIFVSELCLGTMTFGQMEEGEGASANGKMMGAGLWKAIGQLGQSDVDRMIGLAVDSGINIIDTANVYSRGLSEVATGQALRNLRIARQKVVLATKVNFPTGESPNELGLSRSHIMDAVKASLKRLNTDYIDLYQLHSVDHVTPIEETLRALDDLVRQGHVRYIGCSNWAAWQIVKALGIAERLGYMPFASVQANYSLVGRDLEHEIIPMLESENLGLLVWSPLAGGFLSGKFSGQEDVKDTRHAQMPVLPIDEERGAVIVETLRPIAAAHQSSVAQVALAWVLHQPRVTSVIIGARRIEQMEDNLRSVDLQLGEDELAAIDAVAKPPMLYPYWMTIRQKERRVPAPFKRS